MISKFVFSPVVVVADQTDLFGGFSQMGMGSGEVDDAVDVAFEWGAADAVGCEELLCLGGVVELFDEEVRHGVVW